MKKYSLEILLILLFSATILSGQDNKESRIKFDPNRDPFGDVKEASKKAAQENKRIILDVGGEWCIWCHRLDAFIDGNEEIKNYLDANYIVVKVNYSEENKNEKFLGQFPKIEGYPHIFVLDKDGKFLHSQNTGLLEKEKSYDSEKIMTFLKKWTSNKKSK